MSGLVDVAVLCRRFDAAVVGLEMAMRVVLRSEDRAGVKLSRAERLMVEARGELCGLVRAALAVFAGHRGSAQVDEQREAGERLAMVQLVLANRMAALTLVDRARGKLTRGELGEAETEAWMWHFLGLASCDMPVETWTDSLEIPVETPAAEA